MIKISLNWNFKNKTKHFFIDLKIYEKFSIINSSINNPTIITFSKSVWNIVKNKEKKSSSQRVRIFNQYSDSKLTKMNLLNSKLNKLQWNSWTFLEYRTESNSIELVRSKRIEFFQYFDVYSNSAWSNRTHKNIVPMFNLVRFGSFRWEKF